MTEIGVETLKARLSEYLERAREGERILISAHGQSIAVLSPIEVGESAGQGSPGAAEASKVGHTLDRFIGTWSAEQEAEVLEAVEVFERVDESFWR